jgi:hypothetical protein
MAVIQVQLQTQVYNYFIVLFIHIEFLIFFQFKLNFIAMIIDSMFGWYDLYFCFY